MGFGHFGQSHARSAVANDAGAVDLERPAADVLAFERGPAHAGMNSLDDQVAFEFGDRTDDDHHGSTEPSAGVDVLRRGSHPPGACAHGHPVSPGCPTF